jgi:hypothetical protein
MRRPTFLFYTKTKRVQFIQERNETEKPVPRPSGGCIDIKYQEVSTAEREVSGVRSDERMDNEKGRWSGSHDDAAGILLSIVGLSVMDSNGQREGKWTRGGDVKAHLFRRLVKHLALCTKRI